MARHWNRNMSIGGIAAAWRYAGGSWHHQVAACAVALAESGGRRYAISPSADYGLWQINAIHMGEYGLSWRNWMNPVANGHAAVGISHGGTNWAAWCTCWTNPYNNCGHGYLPWPQRGSPAWNQISRVQSVLGGGGQAVTGGGGGGGSPRRNPRDSPHWDRMQADWNLFRHTLKPWAPGKARELEEIRARARRLRHR